MKIRKYSFTVLSCAALTLAASELRAQDTTWELAPRALTFALTLKSTVGGTFEVDPDDPTKFATPRVPAFESTLESAKQLSDGTPVSVTTTSASKVVSTRFGNADLIKELVAGEILAAPASGWALFVLTEEENPVISVVAKKKDQDDVLLEGVGLEIYPVAVTQNFTDVMTNKLDKEQNVITTAVGRGTYSSEGSAYVSIEIGDATAELAGTLTDSGSLFTWYPDPLDKSMYESLLVSKGVRMAGLAGFAGSEEESFWVTGTASLAADRTVKITTTEM